MSAILVKSGWETARDRGAAERADLITRLQREGAWDLVKKLDKCGEVMRLVCANCGSKKAVEMSCMRRWCPACAYQVKRERLKRFDQTARAMKWPLFVTLTKRNTGDPECIREIRADWGRMRRRKLLESKIKGGIATIEITNTGNGWHPHLHILCDCKWLALHVPAPTFADSVDVKRQKYDHARLELSALWCSVIKQDQSIVSALRAKPGEALAYALKYAIKGSDLINSQDDIAPMIRVLEKSRMISAFGDLYALDAELQDDERPKCTCKDCGEASTYMPDWVVDKLYIQSYDRRLGK